MDNSAKDVDKPNEEGLVAPPSPAQTASKNGDSAREVTNSSLEGTKEPLRHNRQDTSTEDESPSISGEASTEHGQLGPNPSPADGNHKNSPTEKYIDDAQGEVGSSVLEKNETQSASIEVRIPSPVTEREISTPEAFLKCHKKASLGDETDLLEGSSDDVEATECAPGRTEKGTPKKRIKLKRKPLPPSEKVKDLMNSAIPDSEALNASDFDQSIPVSQLKDKTKALREEIAKLPTDEQQGAKKDMQALLKYSQMFKPPAKIVQMNWEIKGLKTHLKHHQLKAAAWMRNREDLDHEPNGGLLCDAMGLGKTLTVLAIISNEKFPEDITAPTLIIVPRSLVTQWTAQISAHCDPRIEKGSLEYYAGSRSSRGNVESMNKMLIVLTTYEQVCTSYPKFKHPPEIKFPEEVETWRKNVLEHKAGVFHKMEWHRIVLDEAHVIKNRDTATSIAVRALNGKFKWAISGTPLHNSAEELYPYLDFIYTREKMDYEAFQRKYNKGMDGLLDTIVHRSTHNTRILGKPIVILPRLEQRMIEVEFCSAERLIYSELKNFCVETLNGMAGMAMQSKCILAMISYLRMYASHPLIAQKVLDIVLEPRVVKKLGLIAEEEGAAQTPSGIISQRILSVKNSASLRPKLKGNFSELREKHKMRHKEFHRNKQTEQSSELKTCPSCQELVDEDEPYVVTSCCHLYCTGCFDGLPDQNGRTDTVIRICTSCDKPIKEAACYVKQPEKRKQSKSKRTGYRTQRKRPRGSFKEQVLTKDRQDDEWEEPDENERDWISRIGDGMPSAKLTAIREQVAKWLEEDTEVKIVVFVQYINTIRLLQGICEREDWNFAIMTGRISPTARDKEIEKFGNEKDVHIMLSSLKTGGVGLNLTMANKCILVDPWWNAAIQDQAYCRLYRIGQTRPVEYVKIVAKDSVDTWMMKIQKEKTWDIEAVLSDKKMLGIFGDVHEDPNGVLTIQTGEEHHKPHFRSDVLKADLIEPVGSDEEA